MGKCLKQKIQNLENRVAALEGQVQEQPKVIRIDASPQTSLEDVAKNLKKSLYQLASQI